MHLGTGAITPECAALTTSLAVAGLTASSVVIFRDRPSREKLQQALALGCLVFAAQAVNVPIGESISAHLVGGVLAAWMLGPALAVWTMALVLAIQAVALGDGGLMALGANVLNMAILPAAAWALIQRLSFAPDAGKTCLAAVISIPLAAALIVVETAVFRDPAQLSGWTNFASLMLGTHLFIGVLEGAATAAIVTLACSPGLARLKRPAFVTAACAAALVIALALPISSSLPDGYEAAAAASGLNWLLTP